MFISSTTVVSTGMKHFIKNCSNMQKDINAISVGNSAHYFEITQVIKSGPL